MAITSPVLNQLKTRATGYVGSKFVGVPGQPPDPAQPPAAPAVAAPTAPTAPAFRTAQPTAPSMASPSPTAPAPLPFQREQFRDAWMGSGNKTNEERDAFLAQYGMGPANNTAGRVTLPTGEVIDMTLAGGQGGKGATWTGVAGHGAKAGQTQGASAGGGGADGGGAAGGAAGSDWQSQIRAMLMQQMQGYAKPVSMDDPGIQGEMAAQERTLERTRQDRRAAAAERNATQGLNSGGAGSGAMEADIAAGYEDKGAAKTGLQAQLYSRELTARRDKMMQSLQLALQTGDAESARSLQLKMSQMDNELQRMGLSQRQSQFDDSFGLQKGQFQYDQDRDAARAKAGMNF